MVWFGPIIALFAGGAAIAWALRRSARKAAGGPSAAAPAGSPEPPVPARDSLPADTRLAAAVRRVRTLAYGWPGGVPPKAAP